MRIPRPWFREQTRSWYVKIAGVQHPLGKHPAKGPTPKKLDGEWKPPREITTAWHRLMAGEGLAKPRKDITLPGLVEGFLVDAAKTCTPDTAQWYRTFLEDFAGRFPTLKPADITARHVRARVNGKHKRPWGQSTQRSAAVILKRLLNWGVSDAKLLAENPIADFKPETTTTRDRILDDGEQAKNPLLVSRGRRVPGFPYRSHRERLPPR